MAIPSPFTPRKSSPLSAQVISASSMLDENTSNSPRRPEYGIWTCCKCGNQNHLHIKSGKHPIGAVSCKCPHKPCDTCNFSGSLRYFIPIEEPAKVVLPGPGEELPYGIVCGDCGLSYRAEEVPTRKLLRKVPSMREALKDFHKNKLGFQGGKLRKSKSLMVLGMHDEETPTELEKEAKSTSIQFSGLQCSCGRVSNPETFCFHIAKLALGPLEEEEKKKDIEVVAAAPQPFARHTNPELLAKGHDEATIRIRGREHPNPLRSAPVTADDLL